MAKLRYLRSHTRPHSGPSFQRRHASNYYIMGRQYAEDGAWDEARQLLERALSYDPNLVPALQALASLELSLDRCAIARSYAERANRLAPTDPDAITLLGNIALTERNPTAALACYRRAQALGGDAPDLHFNSGLAHLFLGEAEEAAATFRRILDEDPAHHRAWDALGCALRMQKDYPGAITAFNKSLQLEPESIDTRDHLAQVLLDTGNPEHACQILEGLLVVEPDRHTSRHLLGLAYAALQDFRQATACWEALVAGGVASAETYHLLANAYLHLDESVLARETLQSLVTRYPDHVSGHLQLALLLIEDGEQEEGLQHLEQARVLDPQNPVIAHALVTAEAFNELQEHPLVER